MSLKRGTSRFSGLFRTAAFRLAAVFSLIFGVGAGLLLILLDLGIAHFAEEELRNALRHQMAIMRADVQLEGGAALANILSEHARTNAASRYRYLVIPPSGPVFNSGIPESAQEITGFGAVKAQTSDVLPSLDAQNPLDMLILTERLADNTFMAVGRETYPLVQLREGLHKIALWGGLILILLAMAGGLVVAHLFLRRLELVNTTMGRIIDGNLSERLPAIGFGQEFRELTHNLNRMLDRLEAAISSMRQISTDLAHDLRTPLTRIRNRLEELSPASEEQAEKIESAIAEADGLLLLFNNMLRLARLEAGGLRRDMATVDVAQIVAQAVEAYLPAAEQGGRRLFFMAKGAHQVVGDAALLSQLVANIIDNGLCHTPPGSMIDIEVSSSQGHVQLVIRDDGEGIPEDEIANLTKRFYRIDGSRTQGGTGLGLALAAAIAELHGAALVIRNSHPGLQVELRLAEA